MQLPLERLNTFPTESLHPLNNSAPFSSPPQLLKPPFYFFFFLVMPVACRSSKLCHSCDLSLSCDNSRFLTHGVTRELHHSTFCLSEFDYSRHLIQWNHTMFVPLWQVYFTWHNAITPHSCFRMYQNSPPKAGSDSTVCIHHTWFVPSAVNDTWVSSTFVYCD